MMKSIFRHVLLISTFALVIFSIACNDDEDLPEVVAGFTSSINQETGVVTFTNTSENATDYSWDFGDGTSSTAENPEKSYTADGDYDVVLTASNGSVSDTFEETITISLVVIDEEAPVITLTGDATVELWIGEAYTDAGAEANDNVDGDISSNIIVGGDQVNVFQPGTYTVTYNVSDAAGNAATQVTRTVTVEWEGSGLLTNGDFEDGATGWTGNALDVRTEGNNSYSFADVAAAGNPFDANVSQVLEIMTGGTYKLSFNASSDRERTLIAGIGLNEGNYESDTEEITITTQTQRFTLNLRAAAFGSMNSRVLFDMGAAAGIVVIDNVSLMAIDEFAPAPEDAPATPEVPEANVISLFSDAYTDVPVDTWSAEWDNASQEDIEVEAGNFIKKVSFGKNGGFLGVDFSSNSFDASGATHFHMDYWISDEFTAGQILNPKWSNHAGGVEINAFEYTNAISDGQSGTWVSLDIPISSFATGSTVRDNLSQLILATGQTLDVVYLDNIYLYTAEVVAGPELYSDALDNASDVNSWAKIADATGNTDVTVTHSAAGGVDGSGAVELGINVSTGGAFILRYQKSVNYDGNTSVRISYDAKVTGAISGSALHMQSQVPQDGGGVITTNTFDTQNQINDSGFTTITQEITGLGTGDIFILDLNFATGGAATGSVLIDNIKIEAIE